MRPLPPLRAALLFLSVTVLSAATYIAPDHFDPAVALPPPPADDSPAGRADHETVLQVYADLTLDQIERSRAVAAHTVFDLGASGLGDWFTAENLPASAALLKDLTTECYRVVTVSKNHWRRPRPGVRFPELAPPGRNPARSFSYPSGHATEAVVWARILETAFPETVGRYAAEIRESAWGRVLSADHYPSDTQAGQIFGDEIAAVILASPAAVELLSTLRSEAAPFLRN